MNGLLVKRASAGRILPGVGDISLGSFCFGIVATNFPGSEQPERLTKPANDGFRLDDGQGRLPIAQNFA
jgi:hypothetical protein